MGSLCTKVEADYVIHVWTGDRRNAGTDAHVYVKLHEDQGYCSRPIKLYNCARTDLQRGELDSFHVARKDLGHIQRMGSIGHIELWKETASSVTDWFIDRIQVENRFTGDVFIFPIYRWVRPDYHYQIRHLDTSLPQFDKHPEQRQVELQEKREAYQFEQRVPGGPVQVKVLPLQEQFSFENQWNLSKKKTDLLSGVDGTRLAGGGHFDSIYSMKKLFGSATFPKPLGMDRWRNDLYFGMQRITGLNHSLIRRITAIPEKLPVTDAVLAPLLDGLSISEALDAKSLFLCDLDTLEGLPVREQFTLCAPIGLFFLDKARHLRPVAVQLFQEPGPDNPIFTPLCPESTWSLVKMWFNNADAAYHLAVAKFGVTHFLMEGVAVATHRNLSQSHPIWKFLAPSFLYLLPVNKKCLDCLIKQGGFLDTCTNYGREGFFALIEKSMSRWRMDRQGDLVKDLTTRGLDRLSVLPCYYFRDDALLLHSVIRKYVKSYIHNYYPDTALLHQDKEIQSWASELVRERNASEPGVGILGVPGNGTLETKAQLEQILTCIVFTCSAVHASVSHPQYGEYAFPPNYPSLMKGRPPTDPCTETEEELVVHSLPDRHTMLEIMALTKLMSTRNVRDPLGMYDVQFVFDPQALHIVREFEDDLKETAEVIKEKNMYRNPPYDFLNPENVTNSISM